MTRLSFGSLAVLGACAVNAPPPTLPPAELPHSAEDATYPLVGGHALTYALTCWSCHPSTDPIAKLPADCASCHGQQRPEGHYPDQDCAECHGLYGWFDVATPTTGDTASR